MYKKKQKKKKIMQTGKWNIAHWHGSGDNVNTKNVNRF